MPENTLLIEEIASGIMLIFPMGFSLILSHSLFSAHSLNVFFPLTEKDRKVEDGIEERAFETR